MEFGGYSLTGPRETNEDSYFIQDISDLSPHSEGICTFAMVSDGMGGYQGGDIASSLAVKAAQSYLDKLRSMAEDNQIRLDAEIALREIVQNAHEAILAVSSERGGKSMGATFVGAFVSPGYAWIGHVGDSRAYRIRDGKVLQITEDHSQVGRMLRQGLITEEEAQNHPSRNRIERALGFADAQVDIDEIDFDDGDVLLLCSDGVYTVLQADMLNACVSEAADAPSAAEFIASKSLELGTDDNSTAVVVSGFDGSDRPESSKVRDAVFDTDPDFGALDDAPARKDAEAQGSRVKTIVDLEGKSAVKERRPSAQQRPSGQRARSRAPHADARSRRQGTPSGQARSGSRERASAARQRVVPASRPYAREAQRYHVSDTASKKGFPWHVVALAAVLVIAVAALVALVILPMGEVKEAQAAEPTVSQPAPVSVSSVATTNTVTAQPDVAMSLVFDVSGSMDTPSALKGRTKLESAKRQATDFVSSVRTAGSSDTGGASASVGVVSFSDTARVECDLSSDYDKITQSINAMSSLDMTNIYDGLKLGIDQLNASGSSSKILVLLSDGANNEGHSDDEIRALVGDAAHDGIVIYAIGYGSSGDLDEDLLRYMASTTGGQYSHEDSANINAAAVGIFSMLKKAEVLAMNQEILSESTGAVSQGQTEQIKDVEVTSNGTLVAYLYWPGSKLTLNVVDPKGVELNSSYPGCVIDDSTIPAKIEVANATVGTWKMSVFGNDVSMDREPFYALTAFKQTQAVASGGGGSTDNTAVILFIFAAVAIGAILLVYATSKRKTSV